jgi:hypothetical protein
MAQVVNRWPVTAEARIRSHCSTCGMCGGRVGAWTDFSPDTSVFHDSMIPPVLHTHSFIYHRSFAALVIGRRNILKSTIQSVLYLHSRLFADGGNMKTPTHLKQGDTTLTVLSSIACSFMCAFITNSKEQRPDWEANNSSSCSPETPTFYKIWKLITVFTTA